VIKASPLSPYKGLVPFEDTELDALLFFGRERESDIIASNVLAARLTVLYGPSGVGKTSVLQAGVAHRLRRQARANIEERGHPEFAIVVFDGWSGDPVSRLRAAVRGELSDLFGSALLDEQDGERLADTLARWTGALACDLLLVLDQAEEYFLYHAEEAGLAEELPELVTRPGLRVRVLLSLRDDALAKLDRFKGSIPNLFGNYLRLDHLDRRSARAAIEGPVERYNELASEDSQVELEPALVDAVLAETVAGKVELGEAGGGLGPGQTDESRVEAPYLQLVMERVWEEERGEGSHRLRATTLERLGGAEAIVRAHLHRAVDALSVSEKDVAADVFRYLVTPSGAKIAHGVGDLAEYTAVDERRLVPVLTMLNRERIVRPVDGAGSDGARYEIFHDVLAEAVLAWRRERELDRERRVAARRHRRLLLVAVAALVGLAAMAAVAVYALAQRSDARTSAKSAQARELVARAQSELPIDPLRSIGLALQAGKLEPTPAAEDALRTALIESKVRRILHAGRRMRVNAAAYSPDGSRVVTASEDGTARVFRVRDGAQIAELRHGRSVTDATFSPNGRLLVTASRDRTARLWTASGRPLRTFRHGGPVLDVAVTPDSETLVTIAGDATVHVWSLSGVRASHVFSVPPRAARRIAISPDGRRAVVVGGDRFARVYDLVGGRFLYSLTHESRVLSAAFGPSAEMLVTGTADHFGQTWNLSTLNEGYRLRGHEAPVVDVAVSPNGQFIATASADGTADVWNFATIPRGGLLIATPTLLGHTNAVNDVAFSPNGLYVATSSRDGTARIWTSNHGNLQAVLAGHEGSVRAASFSPTGASLLTYAEDGTARIWDAGTTPELRELGKGHHGPVDTLDVTATLAVTASRDGTARIWNLRGRGSTPLHHDGPVRDAEFSPDGRLVITASADHTARIWRTSGGSPFRTLHHPATVTTAAFSPDARVVATAAADGRVRIWNAKSGNRPMRVVPGVGPLAFSPDGTELATARTDNGIRIWSTQSGEPKRKFSGHEERIVALSFSPDASLLLSGSEDKTARLWSMDSRRVQTLKGHTNVLTSARFSPDGRLVATASRDHDVRLWNVRTGKTVLPILRKHFAIVSDARFSDDGRWLVTAGPQTAGLWHVRSHRLIFRLRGHKKRAILTAAAFVPGSHRIVTTGADGTVRSWFCEICGGLDELVSLAEKRLAQTGRALTAEERRKFSVG
jgi:WD40 repeat protein